MKIKPYSKNAKKHPDVQLRQIAASLREFGWQQPIVVDKKDEIIVGHGRWFAYEKYPEGIDKPWIIKADKLTPAQVKAYRLADNKLNESDWDMELALEELKELPKELLEVLGFDEFEISLDKSEVILEDLRGSGMSQFTVYYDSKTMEALQKIINSYEGRTISEKVKNIIEKAGYETK